MAKVDIEGGEWKLFSETSDATWNKIRQFCCELHIYDGYFTQPAPISHILTQVTKNFKLVHIHGNNNLDHFMVNDKALPYLLECTFANSNYYDLKPSDEVFPTELDSPNFVNRGPDIHLGKFVFE